MAQHFQFTRPLRAFSGKAPKACPCVARWKKGMCDFVRYGENDAPDGQVRIVEDGSLCIAPSRRHDDCVVPPQASAVSSKRLDFEACEGGKNAYPLECALKGGLEPSQFL